MAEEKKDAFLQGKRKIERPRETWRRSINKGFGRVGKTWYDARRIATKRTECSAHVAALCSKLELNEKMEMDALWKPRFYKSFITTLKVQSFVFVVLF